MKRSIFNVNQQMTNCKMHGKEIAKGVNKCVHCGKDPRNFFMKHKIIAVILAFVILSSIGSVMGGKKNSTTPSTTNTKKDEVKEFYAINEDVKLNDAVVKVTKVEKSGGSDYEKPKNGIEFVVVTVSIKNNGKSEISYNPFDFKM